MSTKADIENNEIHLKVNDKMENNQHQVSVSELFVIYFSTLTNDVGGDKAKLQDIEDFASHLSALDISDSDKNEASQFRFDLN